MQQRHMLRAKRFRNSTIIMLPTVLHLATSLNTSLAPCTHATGSLHAGAFCIFSRRGHLRCPIPHAKHGVFGTKLNVLTDEQSPSLTEKKTEEFGNARTKNIRVLVKETRRSETVSAEKRYTVYIYRTTRPRETPFTDIPYITSSLLW